MTDDYVRILRIYEFSGPRHAVEEQIEKSIHGTKIIPSTGVVIKGQTIGTFPEVMSPCEVEDDQAHAMLSQISKLERENEELERLLVKAEGKATF